MTEPTLVGDVLAQIVGRMYVGPKGERPPGADRGAAGPPGPSRAGDGMTTNLSTPAKPVGTGQERLPLENDPNLPGRPKRPAIDRSEAASCSCGARWTGTSKCHCSAANCHRLFSSVATFDRHRVNSKCVAPETIMVKPKDGSPARPALILRTGVWCSAAEFTGAGQLFGRKP